FAGTERTVYVSFDDGDHWQSLRLNLPPSSIRELVVHQDDIVVGTHGRSFWLLNNNTDTPLPPEAPAGQKPPDRAMLDYFLKSAASTPVVLEISDATGKLLPR